MTAPLAGTVAASQITASDARQLLTAAATLDLDRGRLRIRCRLADHTAWWDFDEVLVLLEMASDLCIERHGRRRQLVVTDGIDVFRFDVT